MATGDVIVTLQSENLSEFFGLKTKTGVTTRMFGSNTTWGKITALFCLDSTNRVKKLCTVPHYDSA